MAKKILVIDDPALMRRVISDIINEGNEYEVAAIAKDGLEGFDLIVSNPNSVDTQCIINSYFPAFFEVNVVEV